jgi:hypothetical protein
MCLYPRILDNSKYRPNKKNKGIVPEMIDPRVGKVAVGCGRCMECLKQRSREWRIRLREEIKYDKRGKFVTLTFSNESYRELAIAVQEEGGKIDGYELDNLVAAKGVRRFYERWRKKYKVSVKHWFVTELGSRGTERIHIHGFIFTDEPNEVISEKWKYGRISIGHGQWVDGKKINKGDDGFVSGESIGYITKYLTKVDLKHKEYRPRVFTSPGIGRGYVTSRDSENIYYQGKDTIEYYRNDRGMKEALPMYYRNKLFNEEEREQLWLHKLDEGKRYVLGKECKTEKEYLERRKYAQSKNIGLGFGNDKKNWDLRRYEREKRKLIQMGIMNNGKSN